MLFRLLILLACAILLTVAISFHRPIGLTVNSWLLEQAVWSQLEKRNWGPVYELCEEGVRAHPNNPVLIRGLAAYYHYHAHDPMRAKPWYEKLLKYAPDDRGVRIAYANLLEHDLKQPDQSLLILWQGAKLRPNDTLFLQKIGMVYMNAASALKDEQASKRLYQLALNYFSLVLERNPKHYTALFQSGRIYQRLGNWFKASELFCACSVLSPNTYQTAYNLGYSLIKIGYVDLGFKTLSHAIQAVSEEGHIDTARWLAERIQTIRNEEASEAHIGLVASMPVNPSLLKLGCLQSLDVLSHQEGGAS